MKAIHSYYSTKKTGIVKIFILLILTFIITTSCDLTDPKKDKPKPEGYQEDIPWPSLADSPWPMSLHDPQATGRTKYIGPSQGVLEWYFDSLFNYSNAPVIGTDGTIYTCIPMSDKGLLAIDKNGKINWKFNIGRTMELTVAPILTSDNTIFAGGGRNAVDTIYAVTTEGKLKWKKNLTHLHLNILQSSFIVDKIGNIYFADVYNNVYCYDKNGNQLWITNLNNKIFHNTQFSFSPDGKTLYSPGLSSSVIGISAETGEIVKEYGTHKTYITPVIDNSGNIYTIVYNSSEKKYNFVCFNPEGNEKWSYSVWGNEYVDWNQPCIDKYGNFYFGEDTLYSISYKGKLNWKFPLDNAIIHSPIICDGNNDLYMGIHLKNSGGKAAFISVSGKGKLRWKLILEDDVYAIEFGGCPAIGLDNRIYCPTFISGYKLFSIK